MRFKVGQKVIHVDKDDTWVNLDDGTNAIGPSYLEIVTVMGYEIGNDQMVLFYEYNQSDPDGYNERFFEPLMDISELTEILNAQPAEHE